jgi:hypothetical protein
VSSCRCLTACLVFVALLVTAARAPAADQPILVIYPFSSNSAGTGTSDQNGVDLAALISAEVTSLGGVTVIVASKDTAPADYRTKAQAAGAGLYMTGMIAKAPIGSSLSVIEQLVRTRSGLSIWAHTLTMHTLDDAHGEGANVRSMVLEDARLSTPPTVIPETPAPAATPLFPAPASSSVPGAAADAAVTRRPRPAPAYAVLPFGGSGDETSRKFAARALAESLRSRGTTAEAMDVPPGVDAAAGLPAMGDAVCSATQVATVVAGTLTSTRTESLSQPPQTSVHVAVQTFDCKLHTAGAKALGADETAPISTDAIRAAAAAVVAAYLGAS